jgi:hypothetical protein
VVAGLAGLGVLEAEHLLVEVAGALHVVDLEGDMHDAVHGVLLGVPITVLSCGTSARREE